MANTSKKYFKKDFKDSIWNHFFDQAKSAKNGGEFELLLDRYLPPREKIMFEKRLGVLYLTEKGISLREISREIDVTLKTISFIKRKFKKPKTRGKAESIKKSAEQSFLHKKNSIMPTYVGKGRWRV